MEALLEEEKLARLDGDKERSTEILRKLVDSTKTNEETVNMIKNMSKKKGQSKEALWSMIERSFVLKRDQCSIELVPYSFREVKEIDLVEEMYREEKLPEQEVFDEFLVFLQSLLHLVIEGKIYLEGLRVFVTDSIKQILLSQNRIREALDVIYNVHVETFSSLSLRDTITYQLEQIRLSVLSRDFDRATVLSRRVSMRHLEEIPELKKFYLNRMVFVHLGKSEYASTAEVFNTIRKQNEQEDTPTSEAPALGILYSALSIHEKSSKDVLKRCTESKHCPDSARVIGELFTSKRPIRKNEIEPMLAQLDAKLEKIFRTHIKEIEDRILEHNVLVVSQCYSRITTKKISKLFAIKEETVIFLITEMVGKNLISGTVDQISGVVTFSPRSNELHDWSAEIDSCLDLIIKTAHNIAKAE